MRLFFPALMFVVKAQNLNANAFLNLTEILLEGKLPILGSYMKSLDSILLRSAIKSRIVRKRAYLSQLICIYKR